MDLDLLRQSYVDDAIEAPAVVRTMAQARDNVVKRARRERLNIISAVLNETVVRFETRPTHAELRELVRKVVRSLEGMSVTTLFQRALEALDVREIRHPDGRVHFEVYDRREREELTRFEQWRHYLSRAFGSGNAQPRQSAAQTLDDDLIVQRFRLVVAHPRVSTGEQAPEEVQAEAQEEEEEFELEVEEEEAEEERDEEEEARARERAPLTSEERAQFRMVMEQEEREMEEERALAEEINSDEERSERWWQEELSRQQGELRALHASIEERRQAGRTIRRNLAATIGNTQTVRELTDELRREIDRTVAENGASGPTGNWQDDINTFFHEAGSELQEFENGPDAWWHRRANEIAREDAERAARTPVPAVALAPTDREATEVEAAVVPPAPPSRYRRYLAQQERQRLRAHGKAQLQVMQNRLEEEMGKVAEGAPFSEGAYLEISDALRQVFLALEVL